MFQHLMYPTQVAPVIEHIALALAEILLAPVPVVVYSAGALAVSCAASVLVVDYIALAPSETSSTLVCVGATVLGPQHTSRPFFVHVECVSRRSSLACVWLKRTATETVRVSW